MEACSIGGPGALWKYAALDSEGRSTGGNTKKKEEPFIARTKRTPHQDPPRNLSTCIYSRTDIKSECTSGTSKARAMYWVRIIQFQHDPLMARLLNVESRPSNKIESNMNA